MSVETIVALQSSIVVAGFKRKVPPILHASGFALTIAAAQLSVHGGS